MIDASFHLAGGLGLFLLGMALLTEGLRVMAGETLRRALVRFTGPPLKAFGSGALVTLLAQSSSATTVTVIGFVSAGLLTFPQAIGVVMGASLGTTGTGWLVALLGLKIKLGLYALPLVGLGAFLRLLTHGGRAAFGTALAGFGIIFLGIDFMQEAMAELSKVFRPADLPHDFTGHLLAMLLGIGLTLLLQSSSAAMATTLTALHTGAIHFDQAASVTVGAAIGTTVTGVLAALGGSVPAKRTALAHVIFNLATGLLALSMLPWYLRAISHAQARWGLDTGAVSLAAFHTAFILAGVVLFLPWTRPFARGIERLLKDKGPRLTRHLDKSLLHTAPVALEAVRRSLSETACELFRALRRCLDASAAPMAEAQRMEITSALRETQHFIAKIPVRPGNEKLSLARISELHALDHLLRLQPRLDAPAGVLEMLRHERLKEAAAMTGAILEKAVSGLIAGGPASRWVAEIETQSTALAALRRQERAAILRQTAGGDWTPAKSLEMLDALHWLDHASYHAWRICHYLADGENGAGPPS
ncbi:MAG TPA: Na/Pi symporter [Prosthecobacter sp.]|nr:Na/Pi symporter [Prosthecobacter sp.]HRK14116.1 Na/Pi symporter [Prosthecobacter sp.]